MNRQCIYSRGGYEFLFFFLKKNQVFAQKNHVQSFDKDLIAMMCQINNTIFIEKPQRQAAPNFNRYIAENIDTLPEVTYKISDNDGSSRLQRDWSVWCNVKGSE